ncbi:Cupin-like domain-containing protein [Rozella allomycis CSF55]|uniref:Cupin-like domain-containing protein n=1 Tax=Rozella allomycis (strain CSF55) TaxID=988480 RepID=A0A075AZC9_ROZAC|nr:Cupin-like domain-containing protein [Rozella allomycis CSF55]|eukprot:EPZ33939.1 Cupin-like domain-containing protein [Rozella allomycis CSF55]
MSFGDFILNLETNNDHVHYLQSQNDNLSQDGFAAIRKDVPESIEFASEALDAKPDAVNLWIGNEKSTTSMHKDHYENLYAVVRGCKIFTLYPPNYYPFLKEWEIIPEINDGQPMTLPWITADPENLQRDLPPPLIAVVEEGDLFYLPSLWYHKVEQDGFTVAVNYWYDMHFGC